MTFKDEMKAATTKADDATESNTHDDIARLLRTLNEDLRDDMKDDLRAGPRAPEDDDPLDLDDLGDGEDTEVERRRIPFGKIAAALLTAAGVGAGVVYLDRRNNEAQVETAAVTPAAPASQATGPATSQITAQGGASPAAPPPLVLRAPGTAGTGAAPEALITRAPTAGPVAAPPAPPPAVKAAAELPPAPTEPPRLTLQTAKPVPEPAPAPVSAAPAPAAQPAVAAPPTAPAIVKAPLTVAEAPKPAAPTAPVQNASPPTAPVPNALAQSAPPPAEPPPSAPAKPDTAELQAMLSPKPAPAGKDARKVRSTPAERPRPAPAPSGSYAVQLGSFQKAENAEALSGKLTAKGFHAYTMDWTDATQTQWKVVRVGGYESRDDAARVAGELKAAFGLTPMVVNAR